MHLYVSIPASLFTLALALGACAGPGELPDDIALDSAAIIGGTRSTAVQNAVVLLDIGGEGLCTGTLVAPNLVLTARHCVSHTDEGLLCAPSGRPLEGGRVGADYDAQDITIYTGQRQTTLHAAARGAQLVHDSAKNLCNHDIAFVVLDRDVTGIPIAALRTRETTQVGERVTSVGWGLTRRGVIPSARMQRRNVAVLDVGPSQYSAPTDLLVGESICSGDSGGPALSANGAVIGVVSHGGNGLFDPDAPASGCIGPETENVYTRVAPFKRLLATAFREAGATPRLESVIPST